MRKSFLLLLLFVCGATQIWAGTKMNERPKLVVGIVVDQMRWGIMTSLAMTALNG